MSKLPDKAVDLVVTDPPYDVGAGKSGGVFGNRNFYKEKKLYKHPTVKPQMILKNLIVNSSKENDIVLDPFVGSGSTGVAAKQLNRNFIGMELNKEYFEIAKQRIKEA